jgi:hypothetical protein
MQGIFFLFFYSITSSPPPASPSSFPALGLLKPVTDITKQNPSSVSDVSKISFFYRMVLQQLKPVSQLCIHKPLRYITGGSPSTS